MQKYLKQAFLSSRVIHKVRTLKFRILDPRPYPLCMHSFILTPLPLVQAYGYCVDDHLFDLWLSSVTKLSPCKAFLIVILV